MRLQKKDQKEKPAMFMFCLLHSLQVGVRVSRAQEFYLPVYTHTYIEKFKISIHFILFSKILDCFFFQ
jgi:hypothetical protein